MRSKAHEKCKVANTFTKVVPTSLDLKVRQRSGGVPESFSKRVEISNVDLVEYSAIENSLLKNPSSQWGQVGSAQP